MKIGLIDIAIDFGDSIISKESYSYTPTRGYTRARGYSADTRTISKTHKWVDFSMVSAKIYCSLTESAKLMQPFDRLMKPPLIENELIGWESLN